MIGRRTAGFLAFAALAGCQSAIPVDPLADTKAELRQMDVGKQRWVGVRPIRFCDDPELTNCKGKLSTGSITVEDRLPADLTGSKFLTVRYKVRTSDERSGYIDQSDFNALDSEPEHKRRVAAKADCDKRGGVAVGMTADQVRASCWGKPERINRTVTGRASNEQWVFGIGHYVYLTDGVVTSIQTASR